SSPRSRKTVSRTRFLNSGGRPIRGAIMPERTLCYAMKSTPLVLGYEAGNPRGRIAHDPLGELHDEGQGGAAPEPILADAESCCSFVGGEQSVGLGLSRASSQQACGHGALDGR